MSNISKVIIIAGPTAVGKTSLAIDLARRIGAEIISADSRQCYRELSIGVARPSAEELNQVPHHFIATHSLTDQVNAALFEKEALEITRQLLLKDTRVVVTGGTGLYIKAFMNGLDPIPVVPDEIRKSLQADYEANGLAWLQDQIQRLDPTFWETAEQQNPRRLQRALEVIHATGNSILHFRQSLKAERNFQFLPICLTLPTPILRERIDRRIAIMMNDGWLEEVRQLLPYRHLPALQTVGYRELIEHLDGKTTLEEATNKIGINTWQYARRQMTWWKKQKEFAFLPATEHTLNSLLEQCCS